MNDETEELIEIFLDYLNAQEASCVGAKQKIAKLVKVETSKVAISEGPFLNLKYEQAKGNRIGEYEIAYKNQNKPEWQHAYNVLATNNAGIDNSFSEESWAYRYWIYPKNQDRFYRKLKTPKASKEESGATTAPAPVAEEKKKAIEDVKVLFPENLEGMLTFEEVKDFIVIKTRQFLGSENFAKIAAIVHDAGGQYISAGKDSHFKVPLKSG
jgi:hypothetical protein